jgi:hypothetical protein
MTPAKANCLFVSLFAFLRNSNFLFFIKVAQILSVQKYDLNKCYKYFVGKVVRVLQQQYLLLPFKQMPQILLIARYTKLQLSH